uniref:C2 domain-containing protein n=1 Tax=Compsopogon caeruleus TaxID=31354 RepID=A0A7S1TI86_9RHOD|mmetsp:Transcript_8305/g.16889  ORF Transcript_8305/g.16889 Transcript_8305/m.16889 type:complete len:255 (+) Transcript_8305:354-1118(+)
MLLVYVRPADESRGWEKIGQTETIWDDLRPRFVESFLMPVFDDGSSLKGLRVEIYDRDGDGTNLDNQDFIGAAECLCQEILEIPGHSITLELEDPKKPRKKRGNVILMLDGVIPCDPPVSILFNFTASIPGVANKKLVLIISKAMRKGQWTPVYRSEEARGKVTTFDPCTISKEKLCAGNDLRSFRIELHRKKRFDLEQVGFFLSNLQKLSEATVGQSFRWWSPARGLQKSGVVLLTKQIEDTSMVFDINMSGI